MSEMRKLADTRYSTFPSRIFIDRIIKNYATFAEFYGMEDAIEQVMSYFHHAAQKLEEKKQILDADRVAATMALIENIHHNDLRARSPASTGRTRGGLWHWRATTASRAATSTASWRRVLKQVGISKTEPGDENFGAASKGYIGTAA